MSSGTITLKNKSKSITGLNTLFLSDLQVGDFVVINVGGISYTLPVDVINNNANLILVSEYSGPSQSGVAWYAVPRVALNMVTSALVAQSTEALRGLNYDKQNWQRIFSDDSNVTVTLPDGSKFSGPSWGGLTDSVETISNSVKTVDGKSGGKISSPIYVTGNIDTKVVGSSFGWDASNGVTTINNNKNQGSGGIRFTLSTATGGNITAFSMSTDGNAYAGKGNWVGASDIRIKTNVNVISEPLAKMTSIRGVTWDRLDNALPGIGFIAQSAQKNFGKYVFKSGDKILADGTEVKDVLSPDTAGISAALHQESILALMSIQRKALLTLANASISEAEKKSTLKSLAEKIPDDILYAKQ